MILKHPNNGIVEFDFYQWHDNTITLFENKRKMAVIAPRQSGLSTFLAFMIIEHIHEYDQILISAHKLDWSKEILDKLKFNGISTKKIKLVARNFNDYALDEKTLVILDNAFFDNYFVDKLKCMGNCDFIIGTNNKINDTSNRFKSKSLVPFDYDVYVVNFSETGKDLSVIEQAIKLGWSDQYI